MKSIIVNPVHNFQVVEKEKPAAGNGRVEHVNFVRREKNSFVHR